MTAITVSDFQRGMNAYLWEEAGDGSLRKVSWIGSDLWVHCGTGWGATSWCCHAGTTLYVFESDSDKQAYEKLLQDNLARRRERWAHEEHERRMGRV